MLEDPAIEDARLAHLRRGRLAAGQVTRRICRHKRRDRITEIGRDQNHQPKARRRDRAGRRHRAPAGRAAPADNKISRRLPEPGQSRCGRARGSGRPGHQPAVEGQQPLLDAMVRALKELPGLPIRHQEESHRKPVTQDGNVKRGKESAVARASITAAKGHQGEQGDIPPAAQRQWVARKAAGSRPPPPARRQTRSGSTPKSASARFQETITSYTTMDLSG